VNNRLNILVVEDETIVAMGLITNIENLGYTVVDHAVNVAMAQKMFQADRVDLIVMDIDLKDRFNGIELYKSFQTTTPIIYLTGRQNDEDMLNAISTHPIGYLSKPVRITDLKALLKMVCFNLHTHENSISQMKDIGDGYSFDTEKEELFFRSIEIKLNPKELHLLKYLIDAKGSYVSYKTIETEIYSEQLINFNTIKTFIYRFRKKLEFKNIHSEYGYGIRLL